MKMAWIERFRVALACIAVGVALLPAASKAADPVDEASALALYRSAIDAMSGLAQPRYLEYRLEAQSNGLQVDLQTQGGKVWLNVHGGSSPANWTMNHRTYDYETEIATGKDRYVTSRSFFDPTWYGAYRALYQGMFNSQDAAPPRDPDPHPTSTPDLTLKVIAVSSVMGPGVYHVEDRGPAQCEDGQPGRALHLWPRDKDSAHQLTDVIVELQSKRFCMMRFGNPAAIGFHGYLEQHYREIGGYWLQTSGLVDGTIRAFGISLHHGTWRYNLTDMQFPPTVPDSAFNSV